MLLNKISPATALITINVDNGQFTKKTVFSKSGRYLIKQVATVLISTNAGTANLERGSVLKQ